MGPIRTLRLYDLLDLLTVRGNEMQCEWNLLLWPSELDKLDTLLGRLYHDMVVGAYAPDVFHSMGQRPDFCLLKFQYGVLTVRFYTFASGIARKRPKPRKVDDIVLAAGIAVGYEKIVSRDI